MTIEMKSFAISTLDDIAEGFFHARISDLPESKPSWQEIRKIRLSAAERSGRQQAANAAKQSPAEQAEKEGGPIFPNPPNNTMHDQFSPIYQLFQVLSLLFHYEQINKVQNKFCPWVTH